MKKIKMVKNLKYILVLGLGIFIGTFLMSFNDTKKEKTLYWTLQEDCNIENVGFIKKGTKLRVDESMERFTRCILYLNLYTPEIIHSKEKYEFIPYWLTPFEDSLNSIPINFRKLKEDKDLDE